jgi:hypothetical protein
VTGVLSAQRLSAADMTVVHSYRIVVDGEVGGWLARYLGDATIDAGNGITTIVGPVEDPKELRALAEKLCDLGLEIASAMVV